MTKKLLGLLLSAILIPAALFAQSGKVAGKVTDSKTGEALALANVIIEGTTFGAATNEDGEYVILNVAPGTYTVKARYLGFADQSVTGVVVNTGLTKTVNFKMTSSEIQTAEVVVTAERPLINPNVTNSTTTKTAADIANLPVRGVNNIVALQAGAVLQGGNLYIRGGRTDETAFIVEGVNSTNPLLGGSTSSIIDNAVEEIQVQSGGHSAEYGGANGGVVTSTMKTGGSDFKFGIEGITDGFSADNKSFFGLAEGITRGYNEGVVTVSGPIISNLTFFAAGRVISRKTNAEKWDGVSIPGLAVTHQVFNDNTLELETVKDTINISYPKYRTNSDRKFYDLNANLNYSLGEFSLKFSTTLNYQTGKRGGVDNNYYSEIFNESKVGEDVNLSQIHSLKFTHTIDPTMFYTINASYFNDFFNAYDPTYKNDVLNYGNPNTNSFYVLNSSGKVTPRMQSWSYFGFTFFAPGATTAAYTKRDQTALDLKLDLVKQIGRVHEIKAGFDYNSMTIRNIAYGPFSIYENTQIVANDATRNQLSKNDKLKYYSILESADGYGYDVFGNEFNEGLHGAKKPVFMAAYASDKLEYQDLIINFGLRFDRFDTKGFTYKQYRNGLPVIDFDADGYITEDYIGIADPTNYLSPRLGLSFPVTDKTTFHANFGKYVQQSRLRDIYLGLAATSRNINGGFAVQNPVGFDVKPEKTTSYEIGFNQQIAENASFSLTAFYNDKQDQVQILSKKAYRASLTSKPFAYYSWANGDFATSTGFQLGLTLRRTNRVQANVNYTYSDARGTGSNSSTSFRTVWQAVGDPYLPVIQQPLDFNQTHRGSVELDYRFGNNDGPEIGGIKILEKFGINLLYTFNSGHPFTRFDGYGNARTPSESANTSSTPYVSNVDLRIDKSFGLGEINMNAYVRVNNLLNTASILNVNGQTGAVDDDGYLTTQSGKDQIAQDSNYEKTYQQLNNQNAPGFYSAPRTVILGLRLDF